MSGAWPELSEARDGPTIAALHLFSQIVGKVAVAVLPWRNHGWHVTLHLHPRGLRTEPLHGAARDVRARLRPGRPRIHPRRRRRRRAVCRCGRWRSPTSTRRRWRCWPRPGTRSASTTRPTRSIRPFPSPRTARTRAYDRDSARRLLGALLEADRVFRLFRSAFLGKASPVHFFWGSFDLAVTRFSGRPAPLHPGGIPNLPDDVTREAYSHEVSSAGFWPGGAWAARRSSIPTPIRRPRASPRRRVEPEAARFDEALGEFVLAYEAVRSAGDPDAALLAFLETPTPRGRPMGSARLRTGSAPRTARSRSAAASPLDPALPGRSHERIRRDRLLGLVDAPASGRPGRRRAGGSGRAGRWCRRGRSG